MTKRFFFVWIGLFLLLAACSVGYYPQKISKQQYVINADLPADVKLDGFIKPYRDSLDVRVSESLIISEAEMRGRSGKGIGPSQIALGNFMVDACMVIAQQKAKAMEMPVPEISIFTWGSVRNSLPEGEITLRHIYQLMPFENEMVVLKLSASQTRTLLDRLAEGYHPVAGASIIRGKPNQMLINGKPIEEDKSYYVLSSDYLAYGGDDMAVLKEVEYRYLLDVKVRDAIIEYLRLLQANGQTLKPNYEQRIKD